MIAYIITFLSFLFENILVLDLSRTYFIPLTTLTSILMFHHTFLHQKNYYLFCFCFGILYDMTTNTLFFHGILFCLMGYFYHKLANWFSNAWYNQLFLLGIMITIYRFLSYLIFIVIGYCNVNLIFFFRILCASYLFNLIYGLILDQWIRAKFPKKMF